jgi:hypothetical protein
MPLPAEQVERRRCTALELNLGRHLKTGYHGPGWTKAEVALPGRVPDAEAEFARPPHLRQEPLFSLRPTPTPTTH